jgi:16S rRNA (cytosine967-C5)-methyltransferase
MEEFIKGFQEKFKKVSYPDPVNDLIKLMSIRYSHPEWIVKRWLERYGEFDTRALLGYHNSDKPHIVRVNRLKSGVERIKIFLEQAGYTVTKLPYMKYGLVVAGEKKLYTKEAFKNGEFFIMDESMQIVVEWMSPKPEETIIDACAGSGEKSLAMSGMMGNKGKIISVEFDPIMLERFREKIEMTGCTNIEIISPEEVADYLSKSETPLADKVIVDAPNSQLGNIIRKPEAKWHLTEDQIKDFAKDQLTHLGFYAQFVKPGGELIYAVTSTEPEENEEVINAFLKANDQFERATEHDPIFNDIFSSDGNLYIEPHKHHLSGLFGCKLRRKN